jgi:REP element-mobilizing transposase RayT
MSRGTERRTLFVDESYAAHFLELLEEMSTRFSVQVHAYVLMGNHYHLILRTPEANASRAMQWLNMSFSAWFNAKRQRVGHVFQGRFRSTLVDGNGSWLLALSAYVHLNPVRISGLGLDKVSTKAEAHGYRAPNGDEIKARLKVLRGYRWSSYRCYGNYVSTPDWLVTGEVLRRAGGAEKYRRFVQKYVTAGMKPDAFEGFGERVVLGGTAFLDKARGWAGRKGRENTKHAELSRCVSFDRIVEAVEQEKGERWESYHGRYGDWGTPAVLYLARERSGLTLADIGRRAGGMDYKAVSAAVSRLKKRLAKEPELRRRIERCRARL